MIFIFSANFHHSWQSLNLAYARADILFISINILKFKYWEQEIGNISVKLKHEFNLIINNILNMENIRKNNKNKLITNIVFDEYKYQQKIYEKIIEDNHKFKYSWNKFGASESLQLIKYVSEQDYDWKFNENELNKLFIFFDKKFSKNKLREKVMSLGIEFHFD